MAYFIRYLVLVLITNKAKLIQIKKKQHHIIISNCYLIGGSDILASFCFDERAFYEKIFPV